MASAINAQFNRSTKPKQQQMHTEFKQVRSPLKNKTNPQQSPKRRKHSNTKNLKTIRSSKKNPITPSHKNKIKEHPGRKDRKNDLNTPLRRSIQAIGRMRLSSGKPSTHPERIPSKKITMQADNIDTEPTATNTKTTHPPQLPLQPIPPAPPPPPPPP